jgi:hypothetical protein
VRDILANGRDLAPPPAAAADDWLAPEHHNVRGAAYYH